METSPTIQLFLELGIIIAFAKIAGAAARRLGQPRVFGELIAGVILGPTLLDLPHLPVFTAPGLEETIHNLAELGVLFLMFNIGMDVHVSELVSVGRVAVFGGFLGAFGPVLLTIPVVLLFGAGDQTAALFAGVTLAATSVSISAQTLFEIDALQTKEGNAFLATTLIDDILAVLLVSFVVATSVNEGGGEQESLLAIVVQMGVFIGVAVALALLVIPRLMDWIHERDRANHLTASFAIVLGLLFGWAAESLGGVAAITGAFIAGVGISRTSHATKHVIMDVVSHITYSLLAPIFFVSVGLSADLFDIPVSAIPFALALLAVAVISKIAGCGLGGKLGGLSTAESLRVGVCMVSRGEVGLIIVTLGATTGILDNVMFSSLFLVVLLTTVLTPPLVRIAFRRDDQAEDKTQEGANVERSAEASVG